MRRFRSLTGFLLACAVLVGGVSNANVKEQERDLSRFRAQLLEFFANAGETSPTMIGPAVKDPELLRSVQERIGSMSDDELASLQKAFGETPNWQMAPEMLAASLPEGTVNRVDSAGKEILPAAERGLAFREDVKLLAALGSVLPPEEAAGLGIDRETVRKVREGFGAMDTMQAAAIAQGLEGQAGPLGIGSGLSLDGLDPALAEGARALAEHGPLNEQELEELEAFRDDMVAVASAAIDLRRQAGDHVGAAEAQTTLDRVSGATPEMLFVMGRRVDRRQVAAARRQAEMLRRMMSLDGEELDALEEFRGQLLDVLAASGGAGAGDLVTRLAGLPTEQLLPVRERLEAVGGWQETLPLAANVAHSQRLQTEIAWLQQPQPPAELVADLELYRGALSGQLQALASQPGADAGQLEAFTTAVQSASSEQLAVLRLADEEIGGIRNAGDVSRITAVAAVAVDLDCVVSLGSIDLPLGIGEISLGSINFNWICTPLENAINSVANTVNSIVDGIKDTVNSVWSGIQAFPTTIKDAMTALFNALLDVEINGYSLRELTDPATLKQALGLASDYWNAIPNLPDVPCPPEGTNIPGFGMVGDGDAAARLERYLWISDQLLGMVPDTEISLAVKLPAQLLYGGVQYLSVCLNEAAAAADGRETASYRDTVTTGLAVSNGNQAALMIQLVGLQSQVASFEGISVRLMIEENLNADFGEQIALFQLPASAGGYLELVQAVVMESIQQMESVGENVGNARAFISQAKLARDQGQYKRAYENYQRAYKEVTGLRLSR